jgi:CheY-like chemotaxis protein
MKKILVIDDDAAVCLTLEHLLAAAGYEVVSARDGEEGIRLFRTVQPDLVITDIIMPKMEGIEAILQIKREQPRARIIAMSGGGRIHNTDFLKWAQALGAQSVIAKPWTN